MNLTPLGIFHTILSVVAVASAVAALVREGRISPNSRTGRLYIGSLVITCLTGLPIFRHGRFSAYVETMSYSATVFFLGISTVTETLTRLPPSAPVVASPEAPVFKILYLGLLVLFLIGATLQLRALRDRKLRGGRAHSEKEITA